MLKQFPLTLYILTNFLCLIILKSSTLIYYYFQLSALLAAVSGLPQYDYSQPSGGFPVSPGGGARPSGGKPSSKYIPSGGPDYFEGEQPPLIQKHVYLHVPPPELEEAPTPPKAITTGRKEKHYKIIFVKAPTPAQPAAPVIPVQAGKEEKTIVYVLVKKPDDAPQINIPTPAPTEPVKPEVYFIRYKAVKKDGAGGDEGYPDGRPSTGGSTAGGSTGGQSANYLPPRRS